MIDDTQECVKVDEHAQFPHKASFSPSILQISIFPKHTLACTSNLNPQPIKPLDHSSATQNARLSLRPGRLANFNSRSYAADPQIQRLPLKTLRQSHALAATHQQRDDGNTNPARRLGCQTCFHGMCVKMFLFSFKASGLFFFLCGVG